MKSSVAPREVKFFELVRAVKNPKPDRRSNDWYNKPVLAAGMRFIWRETLNRAGYEAHGTIRPSTHSYGFTPDNDPLAKAILNNSKPVDPKTWKEFATLHDCDYGAEFILEALVKLRLVNGEHFAAVADMPEEDEAA